MPELIDIFESDFTGAIYPALSPLCKYNVQILLTRNCFQVLPPAPVPLHSQPLPPALPPLYSQLPPSTLQAPYFQPLPSAL